MIIYLYYLPSSHRAFRINELKTEVTNRLAMLEKRVERKWYILPYNLDERTPPSNTASGDMFLKWSPTVSCYLVSVEGLKVVEIEKCKNDLKKLRDEMTSRGGGRWNEEIKH